MCGLFSKRGARTNTHSNRDVKRTHVPMSKNFPTTIDRLNYFNTVVAGLKK